MFLGEAACLIVFYLNLYFLHYNQPIYNALPQNPHSSSIENNEESISDYRDAIDVEDRDDTHSTSTSMIDGIEIQRLPLTGNLNFLLWIPTLCDMIATSLMNVGLIFVSASIYQVCHGL